MWWMSEASDDSDCWDFKFLANGHKISCSYFNRTVVYNEAHVPHLDMITQLFICSRWGSIPYNYRYVYVAFLICEYFLGAEAAVCARHHALGGAGAVELAEAIMVACRRKTNFRFLYDLELPIKVSCTDHSNVLPADWRSFNCLTFVLSIIFMGKQSSVHRKKLESLPKGYTAHPMWCMSKRQRSRLVNTASLALIICLYVWPKHSIRSATMPASKVGSR